MTPENVPVYDRLFKQEGPNPIIVWEDGKIKKIPHTLHTLMMSDTIAPDSFLAIWNEGNSEWEFAKTKNTSRIRIHDTSLLPAAFRANLLLLGVPT